MVLGESPHSPMRGRCSPGPAVLLGLPSCPAPPPDRRQSGAVRLLLRRILERAFSSFEIFETFSQVTIRKRILYKALNYYSLACLLLCVGRLHSATRGAFFFLFALCRMPFGLFAKRWFGWNSRSRGGSGFLL